MLQATPDMLHNLACAHIERGEMEAALATLDEAERVFVEEVGLTPKAVERRCGCNVQQAGDMSPHLSRIRVMSASCLRHVRVIWGSRRSIRCSCRVQRVGGLALGSPTTHTRVRDVASRLCR